MAARAGAALALCLFHAVVLAGPMAVRGPDGTHWRVNDDEEPSLLERKLPGGALDTAFGKAGRLALDFGGIDASVAVLRVDTSGRIWLGVTSLATGTSSPMVQRLQANGMADTSWGAAGRSIASPVGQRLMVVDLLPADDGGAWVTGTLYGSQGENDTGLWRLKPNGALEYGFGAGGLWKRPGLERSRPLSLAAGPDGVVALGVDVLTGPKPGREVYVVGPKDRQPRLAPMPGGPTSDDDDDDVYLLWGGLGWLWRTGLQTAELSGLPALTMTPAPAAAVAPAPGEAGHIALNPFARVDAAASAATTPPVDDDLPWGWLLAGGVGLLGLFTVWWRGRGKAA
ncbi:MAG TPA: hypothetical protein VFY73_08190 [Ideonella sp.]|uniref:hypothetical protein n=1 Tax=Ideonella sp. TaxID=1929293 RepID=UPI002E315E68|nr:hypothetical protein [Ideonella sp.]HEX5684001.1 hypothetical protein [Ideonella sp.]